MRNLRFVTSHGLAKELFDKEDSYITITIGEKEYVISDVKRVKTHANADDTTIYLTLVGDECSGNIKR